MWRDFKELARGGKERESQRESEREGKTDRDMRAELKHAAYVS